MSTITTNEWTNAELKKPPLHRHVLVRCENGNEYVAIGRGFYWVNAKTGLRTMTNGLTPKHKVTHWYMYEKFNENDIL